jgi:hypothetical protein
MCQSGPLDIEPRAPPPRLCLVESIWGSESVHSVLTRRAEQ